MPLAPSLQSVLNEWLESRLGDLHTAMPAKVKSYDAAKQTLEAIPVIKQSLLAPDGSRTEFELPIIPNVRVLWPRAGGFYIHFPISEGDYCQLIFNEAAIGFWRQNGAVASPGDLERHGLSHPYALPGGWPDQDAFSDAPGNHGVIVVAPGQYLRVTEAGAPGDFVALKAAVDALQEQLDTHVHPTGVGPSGAVAVPMGPQQSSTTLKA